jgi:alpha-D-ribose 1-methylphosphonate 5-triphosphate diphosphatase
VRSNSMSMVIENASVVTPSGVRENASVEVTDGIITGIGESPMGGSGRRLDAEGMYVLPGLIDLHSDAIEKEIEPRAGAYFPVNMAVFEMDKKLAACGITTMYHSVSIIDNNKDLRDPGVAMRIIREIGRLAPRLNVRTRVHARFDVQSINAAPDVERLIDDGCVQLFSIMDHTPGQGQFRKITAYSREYIEQYGLDAGRPPALPLDSEFVRRLVRKCRSRGIPVASHDDDSVEKLDVVEGMGIAISEFPVNMEAVAEAAVRGMHVCFGSPNIVRGSSISGNLSARDAIKAGYGDILCSDYAPMSLLHSIFTVESLGVPLHRAACMASLNPARAAGIDRFTGSIEPGKSADLIIVDPGEVPKVLKTFVGGREVYSTWRSPAASAAPAPNARVGKAWPA